MRLSELDEELWWKKGDGMKAPRRVAWSCAWAMVWMLRSIEAAAVKVGHVKLDWKEKTVELVIPKSGMDQAGKGVRRTLACCGASTCERACAWWLAVQALSESGAAEDGPLFPTTEGKPCSRLQLAASWQKEINGEMTGHSGRRSGAMMYARSGLQLFDIAFLGRWKSSAVMGYIEEAMELLAINQRAVGNPQANRMPGGGVGCIKVGELQADTNRPNAKTKTRDGEASSGCRLTRKDGRGKVCGGQVHPQTEAGQPWTEPETVGHIEIKFGKDKTLGQPGKLGHPVGRLEHGMRLALCKGKCQSRAHEIQSDRAQGVR